jgi:hypothetical protein
LVGSATSCGAAAHAKKFQPPASTAFLKENEVRAFCTPALDLSILTPAQCLRIQGVQLTKAEWVQLFKQLKCRNPPKWLTFEEEPSIIIEEGDNSPEADLRSPTHASAGTLLGLIPMLSFDSVPSTEGSEDESLDDTAAHIQKLQSQFATLKTKWLRAFSEVESGYSLIVQDLQKMHHLVLDQAAALGAPAISRNETTSSAWDKINQVQQSVASVASSIQAQAATLEHLSEEQNNLTQSVIALESTAEDAQSSLSDKVTGLTIDLRALENRVLRLVPLLSQLKRGATSGPSTTSLDGGRLKACEETITILKGIVTDIQTQNPTNLPSGPPV